MRIGDQAKKEEVCVTAHNITAPDDDIHTVARPAHVKILRRVVVLGQVFITPLNRDRGMVFRLQIQLQVFVADPPVQVIRCGHIGSDDSVRIGFGDHFIGDSLHMAVHTDHLRAHSLQPSDTQSPGIDGSGRIFLPESFQHVFIIVQTDCNFLWGPFCHKFCDVSIILGLHIFDLFAGVIKHHEPGDSLRTRRYMLTWIGHPFMVGRQQQSINWSFVVVIQIGLIVPDDPHIDALLSHHHGKDMLFLPVPPLLHQFDPLPHRHNVLAVFDRNDLGPYFCSQTYHNDEK